MANGFSLEVFFNIADALEIDPSDLINASMFPEEIAQRKKVNQTIVKTQGLPQR